MCDICRSAHERPGLSLRKIDLLALVRLADVVLKLARAYDGLVELRVVEPIDNDADGVLKTQARKAYAYLELAAHGVVPFPVG